MNPLFMTDGYKLSHHKMYPEGIEKVYSNFTPRSSKHAPFVKDNLIVNFGTQFAIEYIHTLFRDEFFNKRKAEVLDELKKEFDLYLGIDYDISHFEDLHDIQYLPIIIKALPEGALSPIGVPVLTIENTIPRFFWITNYLETLLSQLLWKSMTSATIAFEYRKLITDAVMKTDSENAFLIDYMGHDFSARGLDPFSTMTSGMAHLLSFKGSDSIAAIKGVRRYYHEKSGVIATSVPASEHSVMCAGGNSILQEEVVIKGRSLLSELEKIKEEAPNLYEIAISIVEGEIVKDSVISSVDTDGHTFTYIYLKIENSKIVAIGEERVRDGGYYWREEDSKDKIIKQEKHNEVETFRRILKAYPTGIVSIVSDTWDLWHVLTVILPQLKDEIMARDGKVVIRPDSGNPADIICGIAPHMSTKTYDDGHEVQMKGAIELLWDVFGGTISKEGYKVLDLHIGLIYGDSITITIAQDIFDRLKTKGFAATNVVLGIGSYTYQYNTRDTLGFAMKATNVTINGVDTPIFKDPVTDSGVKKSAKGLLCVGKVDDNYILINNVGRKGSDMGYLRVIYENGRFHNPETFTQIRERLNLNLNKYVQTI